MHGRTFEINKASEAEERLKVLNEKLDNRIYFLAQDLEHGNYEADEDRFYEMLSRRNSNNDLLEFESNDRDEIEEHLSDLIIAIVETEELLN